MNAEYLARFEIQKAGESMHAEYWIPAAELPEFNANFIGLIEVIEKFGTS